MVKPKKVIIIARFFQASGLSSFLFFILKWWHGGRFIRIVNYHGTEADYRESFESQLVYYKKYYQPMSLQDVERVFDRGGWNYSKPGIILTFDDGLKSNYDVAVPLLEKHGFTGMFFISSGLIREDRNLGRYMSWDELKNLSVNHVVGCHTHTHMRLKKGIDDVTLEKEIYQSKKLIESHLGESIDSFCWVGGEKWSYSSLAALKIREAGYKYSFMTNCYPVTCRSSRLQLQRTNIEANWPLFLVNFYLCGLVDLVYTKKRRYVNTITS